MLGVTRETPDEPAVLAFEAKALQAFDEFCECLESTLDRAEGLEESWLGKGKGTVARLAGVLALMAWSETDHPRRPWPIDVATVLAAIELWTSYFYPHAATVFHQCGRIDRDRHARRAAKWIKARARELVSREELRRDALGQSVDAGETDRVIQRLEAGGVLRLSAASLIPNGGRPAKRWTVNPAVYA